jgi:hypothetical protein
MNRLIRRQEPTIRSAISLAVFIASLVGLVSGAANATIVCQSLGPPASTVDHGEAFDADGNLTNVDPLPVPPGMQDLGEAMDALGNLLDESDLVPPPGMVDHGEALDELGYIVDFNPVPPPIGSVDHGEAIAEDGTLTDESPLTPPEGSFDFGEGLDELGELVACLVTPLAPLLAPHATMILASGLLLIGGVFLAQRQRRSDGRVQLP